MKFSDYSKYLDTISSTSSRTEMTVLLAELINNLSKEDISAGLYMIQGRVAGSFEPLELNFSAKSIVSALQELVVDINVKEIYSELGDVGLVAEKVALEIIRSNEKNTSNKLELDFKEDANDVNSYTIRSVAEVFKSLQKIASQEGKGSSKEKKELFKRFFLSLVENEGEGSEAEAIKFSARYFAKIAASQLRLGVSERTLLDAISWALKGDKSIRKELDQAYGVRADIGSLAVAVVKDGAAASEINIELGIPLAAELVERESDAEAIIKRHTQTYIQPKYDGLRLQLHFKMSGFVQTGEVKQSESETETGIANQGENITAEITTGAITNTNTKYKLFSRNMEPLTPMFPEIGDAITALAESSGVVDVILDGEVIAFSPETGEFLPFQETSQRRRKYGIAEISSAIPVKYFAFDIIYLNGRDLMNVSFDERLALLRSIIPDENKQIKIAETTLISDPTELEAMFRNYLDKGLEGIIAKSPDSFYKPGTRSYDWIKLKANTYTDMKDTVDAVIMGYYKGKGARAKFGVGGFLVGIYNPETDTYQSIAKVGSGLKEKEWAEYKMKLDQFIVTEVPRNFEIARELIPDVIVEPKVVVVVDADEISLSKAHSASYQGKTFSLRFPRINAIRHDKSPSQTTTPEEINTIFQLKSAKGIIKQNV